MCLAKQIEKVKARQYMKLTTAGKQPRNPGNEAVFGNVFPLNKISLLQICATFDQFIIRDTSCFEFCFLCDLLGT